MVLVYGYSFVQFSAHLQLYTASLSPAMCPDCSHANKNQKTIKFFFSFKTEKTAVTHSQDLKQWIM